MENSTATPESILALLVTGERTTLSGKNTLVIGYGPVGCGVARLWSAHGSAVTVVESDPLRRTVAAAHGHATADTRDIDAELPGQDVVVSCTQNADGRELSLERLMLMKDGAVIVNAGTGTGEVSPDVLNPGIYERNRATISVVADGPHRIECRLEKAGMSKTIRILCGGCPLNLGCGNGTTDEVMDAVFATALVTMVVVDGRSLPNSIHPVGADVEGSVAAAVLPPKYAASVAHVAAEELVREGRPWGGLYRFAKPDSAPLKRFSLARAAFDPHSTTDGHYHAVSEEAYLVESGSADILVWDPKEPSHPCETHRMLPGGYLPIPRGMAHRVFAGDEGFVCVIVASPPFSFWDQFFPGAPPNES